jgi:hypothetical protein
LVLQVFNSAGLHEGWSTIELSRTSVSSSMSCWARRSQPQREAGIVRRWMVLNRGNADCLKLATPLYQAYRSFSGLNEVSSVEAIDLRLPASAINASATVNRNREIDACSSFTRAP